MDPLCSGLIQHITSIGSGPAESVSAHDFVNFYAAPSDNADKRREKTAEQLLAAISVRYAECKPICAWSSTTHTRDR